MKKQDVFFIIELICLVPLIAFLLFSLDNLAIFCSILIFVLTVLGVIAMYLDNKNKNENDSNELIKIVGDLWVAWTYDSKRTNEEFFKHFNNCRNKRLRLKIINEIKNREKEMKIFNEKFGS